MSGCARATERHVDRALKETGPRRLAKIENEANTTIKMVLESKNLGTIERAQAGWRVEEADPRPIRLGSGPGKRRGRAKKSQRGRKGRGASHSSAEEDEDEGQPDGLGLAPATASGVGGKRGPPPSIYCGGGSGGKKVRAGGPGIIPAGPLGSCVTLPPPTQQMGLGAMGPLNDSLSVAHSSWMGGGPIPGFSGVGAPHATGGKRALSQGGIFKKLPDGMRGGFGRALLQIEQTDDEDNGSQRGPFVGGVLPPIVGNARQVHSTP